MPTGRRGRANITSGEYPRGGTAKTGLLYPGGTMRNQKEVQVIGILDIQRRIMPVRGVQVMLDRDLAALYGVETRALNQAVRRNIGRFPEDFMFQLSKEDCLRSQIVTLNEARGKHLKYLPYAFTENGIAMLSSVLRSETAIDVNIRIMRAFTAMRRFRHGV